MIWHLSDGRCSNLECPNRAHEGNMAVIRTTGVTHSGRGISLYLCKPCAVALSNLNEGGA